MKSTSNPPCLWSMIFRWFEPRNSLITWDLGTRLHWHAIFDDVLVFDTCQTWIPAWLAGLWCSSGVPFLFFCFFIFLFFVLFRFSDTVDTLVVKKKITDFDSCRWKFRVWEVITMKVETHRQLSVLDRADRWIGKLHRQSSLTLCPLSLSISLSLSQRVQVWVRPLLFSISIFFFPNMLCTVSVISYNAFF